MENKSNPVAPESYKPAEGPHPLQSWQYKAAFAIAKMKDSISTNHYDVLKIMNVFAEFEAKAAATPVTVEAPATPKPIGDVRQIAINILANCAMKYCHPENWSTTNPQSVIDQQVENAAAILSPLFAPAGPEISADAIRHLVDCVHIGLNGSVSAHEGFGNSSCIACIVGLKLAANGTASAQPPCSECATRSKEVEKAQESRKHTQDWYAGRYGKLEDWARKILPEPYCTQFFSCIANGTYDALKDVGEPYMSKVGLITPSGYVKFSTAQEQILHDQTTRAEAAEAQLSTQLQAFKDARDSLNDALSHLRHSSNENAIIYVKEGLKFISAALAPTPEVAKE